VDSGFVHDIMDTASADHYFVRAHVWPSMRNELPHNVTVVISGKSGAILHVSCEPCRASSLGRYSHVVAVLFSVLDYVQKHGPSLTQPCTSQGITVLGTRERKETKIPGGLAMQNILVRTKTPP